MTLSNPAQYISGRTVQEQMNSLIDYVDQRAADVALDAIASDVAQVHQDMLDADADAAAAAASAAAAAGTLANAVKKTGEVSQSIQGDVNVVGDFTAGATRLNGATAINADLSVVGDLSVSNDATLSGTTSVLTQATGTYSAQAASGLKVKNELDNYAPMVRTTGNQTIAGNKEFTGILINATGAPTFSKVPENVGGKYLALFQYQGQAVMSMRIIAGVSNSVVVFDLRGGNATCGVETHAITGERYVAPGDILVCTNDTSNKTWTVYMKYPQNRRVMIYLDSVNSMFGNITLNPSQITSVFTGTLIDDPSGDYSEVIAGQLLELKVS